MFMCWILGYQAQEFDIELYSCTIRQPRHERMLRWLDLELTHGVAMSKGEETLAARYYP